MYESNYSFMSKAFSFIAERKLYCVNCKKFVNNNMKVHTNVMVHPYRPAHLTALLYSRFHAGQHDKLQTTCLACGKVSRKNILHDKIVQAPLIMLVGIERKLGDPLHEIVVPGMFSLDTLMTESKGTDFFDEIN